MKKKTLVLIITYALIVFFLFPLRSNAESENPIVNGLFGLKKKYYQMLYEKDLLKPSGFERFGGWWDPLDLYKKDEDFRRRSQEAWEKMEPFMDGLSTLKRWVWDDLVKGAAKKIKELNPLMFPDPPPEGSNTMPEGFNWKIIGGESTIEKEYNGKKVKLFNLWKFNQASDGKYYIEAHSINIRQPYHSTDEGEQFWGWHVGASIPKQKPSLLEDPNYYFYYDFKKYENKMYCHLLVFDRREKRYLVSSTPYTIRKLVYIFNDLDDNFDDPEYEQLFEDLPDGYVWQPDWSKLPGVKKHMGPDGKIWYSVDQQSMFDHAKDLPMIKVKDGEGYDVYYDKNPGQFFLVPQGSDFPPLRDDAFTLKPRPDITNPGQGQPQNPGQPGQPQDPNQPPPPPPPVDPEQPENLRPPTQQDIQKQQNDAFQAIKDIEFNPEIKKRDWKGKFPFSLPFDVAGIFKSMAVRPKPIVYKIDFGIFGARVNYTVDFTPFQKLIKLVRFFFLLSFTMTLIGWTRKIAKW